MKATSQPFTDQPFYIRIMYTPASARYSTLTYRYQPRPAQVLEHVAALDNCRFADDELQRIEHLLNRSST